MSAAPELNLMDLRAESARFCEFELPEWRWLTTGIVGQARCLRCQGVIQVDLTDRVRLVKCLAGCGSSWTLKNYCSTFGLPAPPTAGPINS